jgi:hypothetical protein
MSVITLAALVLALVAGWGIGQLAGGGSGEEEVALRPLPTLEPTATPEREPTATPEPPATVAASPTVQSSPGSTPEPEAGQSDVQQVQRPTSVPQAP